MISDSLYNGRRYCLQNIIDEFNRELLDAEIDHIHNTNQNKYAALNH
jgi:hypothetical protein